MGLLLAYRGRQVTEAEAAFIRTLIAAQPQASRRALSLAVCAAWDWVQPNGRPRDMVCRGLLLALHRAGHIALPPARWDSLAAWRRHRPAAVAVDATLLRGRLAELGALTFRQVRRSADERLFNSLIATHHYLGYTQPVGEHLKYLVYAGERPVACFAWSSAPRHLAPRDRYLGWAPAVRRRNVRLVAYNSRFLILPWVEVPHLASHLLGRMARLLPAEWARVYGHPVHFAETFTDPTRFRGTCYRAANWMWLGQTTGRGKADLTHQANRPLKDVWGYPLVPDFRARLGRVA
ncbi:MAG TPA: Druantia anti-phage system protein DruA [Polyangia bacterium]